MAITKLYKDTSKYKRANHFKCGDVCIGEDGSHLLVMRHPTTEKWQRFVCINTGEMLDFAGTSGVRMSDCAYILLQNGGQ